MMEQTIQGDEMSMVDSESPPTHHKFFLQTPEGRRRTSVIKINNIEPSLEFKKSRTQRKRKTTIDVTKDSGSSQIVHLSAPPAVKRLTTFNASAKKKQDSILEEISPTNSSDFGSETNSLTESHISRSQSDNNSARKSGKDRFSKQGSIEQNNQLVSRLTGIPAPSITIETCTNDAGGNTPKFRRPSIRSDNLLPLPETKNSQESSKIKLENLSDQLSLAASSDKDQIVSNPKIEEDKKPSWRAQLGRYLKNEVKVD